MRLPLLLLLLRSSRGWGLALSAGQMFPGPGVLGSQGMGA